MSDYGTGYETERLNQGHGHVFERPDGVKARCGGIMLCNDCKKDFAVKNKDLLLSSITDVPNVPKIRYFYVAVQHEIGINTTLIEQHEYFSLKKAAIKAKEFMALPSIPLIIGFSEMSYEEYRRNKEELVGP